MLHRKIYVAAVAALTVIGAGGRMSLADNDTIRKIYTNRAKFKLPLQVDDRERDRLQQIKLFVKSGPSAPWVLQESIAPTQREFVYHAPQDGEYSFSLVTVDRANRSSPADVSAEPPGLVVVVDREPPVIEVIPIALGAGQQCLQCNIRDANPDPSRTKLEYQTPDRSWQALELIPDQPGCYRVPDPSIMRGSVRATAADRSNNVVVEVVNLGPPPVAKQPDPVALQPTTLEVPAPQLEVRPLPPSLEMKSAPSEPRAVPLVPETNALPLQSEVRVEKIAAPPPTRPMQDRHYLNTTQISLRYQIEQVGPSGVGKVEAWITTTNGESWHRLCEQPGHQNPLSLQLPGEGVYGINVVATNGNGIGGEPPSRGESPEWRVEVDTTKPVASLTSARIGAGNDAGTLVINWLASDKNLRAEPIDLWYAHQSDGPWIPIAKSLKNDMSYRWLLPRESADQFYVRLDVTDLAGNTTSVQTPQPILIDRTRLKAHVIGVAPGGVDR